jgi:hypothetical protein
MSVSSATTRTVCIDDSATRSHGSFAEWDACDEHPYNERGHFHPVGLREWDRCPEGVCCSPDNGRCSLQPKDFSLVPMH